MYTDKMKTKELTDEENKTGENLADLPVSDEQADETKGGSRNGNLQITQHG